MIYDLDGNILEINDKACKSLKPVFQQLFQHFLHYCIPVAPSKKVSESILTITDDMLLFS